MSTGLPSSVGARTLGLFYFDKGSRAATTMQHGGPNREVGEGMERAIKHTYICGSDEWVSEAAEVSIAPRSFAQVRGRRFVHPRCLRLNEPHILASNFPPLKGRHAEVPQVR